MHHSEKKPNQITLLVTVKDLDRKWIHQAVAIVYFCFLHLQQYSSIGESKASGFQAFFY